MTFRKVVFVDVDDTLVRSFGAKRIPISAMVERVRELHLNGIDLYCWSSGGAEYARNTAVELGIEEAFRGFLPKPNLLIDGQHPSDWRFGVMHPNEAASRVIAELVSVDRGPEEVKPGRTNSDDTHAQRPTRAVTRYPCC